MGETRERSHRFMVGVGRNVAEDIANVELEPTFVSSVDDDAMGEDVIRKLDRHKVNTKYMKKVKNGMGTWLAVFDHEGDVVSTHPFPNDQITNRLSRSLMNMAMKSLKMLIVS